MCSRSRTVAIARVVTALALTAALAACGSPADGPASPSPPESSASAPTTVAAEPAELLQQAMRKGATIEQAFAATKIDPWFLDQIALINEVAEFVRTAGELDAATLRIAKEHGFSDAQIAQLRRDSNTRQTGRLP